MRLRHSKTGLNGLSRATGNKACALEYARRSRTLREKRSAYDSTRRVDALYVASSRVAPQEIVAPAPAVDSEPGLFRAFRIDCRGGSFCFAGCNAGSGSQGNQSCQLYQFEVLKILGKEKLNISSKAK